MNPCNLLVCGPNAYCESDKHAAWCRCSAGYAESVLGECVSRKPTVNRMLSDNTPIIFGERFVLQRVTNTYAATTRSASSRRRGLLVNAPKALSETRSPVAPVNRTRVRAPARAWRPAFVWVAGAKRNAKTVSAALARVAIARQTNAFATRCSSAIPITFACPVSTDRNSSTVVGTPCGSNIRMRARYTVDVL